MKKVLLATLIASVCVPAMAQVDSHSKAAVDGKKAFGGFGGYQRSVDAVGQQKTDAAVRSALGRDHGDGRFNAAEHDLSSAREAMNKALQKSPEGVTNIKAIKHALELMATSGAPTDAKTIAEIADVQRQVQMTEYNARMAALRAAQSARVAGALAGSYTPATEAQITRAADLVRANLESGKQTVAQVMGHISEQIVSGKVDPNLTTAMRAAVHSFVTSHNAAPDALSGEQAASALKGISDSLDQLRAGTMTVSDYQNHIDEQKASGSVHAAITGLEQKALNDFVASRFNVVTQQTPARLVQQEPQAVPALPPMQVPGATPSLHYAVPELPNATAPSDSAAMTDNQKARLAQMISDMKAQGVTQKHAQQSVEAFVKAGRLEEAMMVSDAFGLTKTVSPVNTPSFSGVEPQKSVLTGESVKSYTVTGTPTVPSYTGGYPVPVEQKYQVAFTGTGVLHVPDATAPKDVPVAVPAATREYQEPVLAPKVMEGQIVPNPIPQGAVDQRIPQVKLVEATPLVVPNPVPVLAPKPRQPVPQLTPVLPNKAPVLAPKPRQPVPNAIPVLAKDGNGLCVPGKDC